MGCCGSTNKSKHHDTRSIKSNLSPVDQLKIRLASGEITIEEFIKTKAVLQEQ